MLRILLNESLSSDAFEGTPVQRSLSRTTTSHIHSINKVNLTKLERNCFDWTKLDRAMWSNGWCLSATASPLHLSVGGCNILIAFTVRLCGQRGILYYFWCGSDLHKFALDYHIKIFRFFNSGVFTCAQIQDFIYTYILVGIVLDFVLTRNVSSWLLEELFFVCI